ncbi:MAG: hypothetical protein RMM10_09210, partial [Anaerolineae bacterium]
ATHEAVALCRRLADQHPDAFIPDLVGSLGAYGLVLMSLGRALEACAAFAEGLRRILRIARADPAAFRDLIAALRRYYLQACQATGQEPERDLIE